MSSHSHHSAASLAIGAPARVTTNPTLPSRGHTTAGHDCSPRQQWRRRRVPSRQTLTAEFRCESTKTSWSGSRHKVPAIKPESTRYSARFAMRRSNLSGGTRNGETRLLALAASAAPSCALGRVLTAESCGMRDSHRDPFALIFDTSGPLPLTRIDPALLIGTDPILFC